MLLTTTGQWMQEDPKTFDAGDSNLRRYVEDDPTNMVDPSGLAPNEVTEWQFGKPSEKDALKTPVVAFTNDKGEKGEGTIVVETDGDWKYKDSGKVVSKGIRISVTSKAALPKDTHWIQFASVLIADKDNKLITSNLGSEVDGYISVKREGKVVYVKNGVEGRVVDSGSLTNVYYDSAAAHRGAGGENELSIFDHPRFGVDDVDRSATTQSFKFETFLVINNKPVYKVEWTYYQIKDEGKWSPVKYGLIKGYPVTEFPRDITRQKNLIGGYYGEEKDGKIVGVKSDPLTYKNIWYKE
jgi:hypothetical protein